MAIQTKLWAQMSGKNGLLFEVFAEYDDADYQKINDDGDPDDFRIVRWFGTNHSTQSLVVSVQRGNGQNWVERTVPSGQSFSQNAGGAVKYESDVPSWGYWWE